MSTASLEQAIADKLIDREVHSQLLADIEGFTRTAGIPERFVWTSIRDYCEEDEITYIHDLLRSLVERDGECLGMVYIGNVEGASANDRMMAIAGICLRNYINAKVMTVQDVLQAMKDGTMPGNVSVLLIPNFFMDASDGGHIAKWQISELIGMLYKRQQEGKHTVLYVSDLDSLESEYGLPFRQHLRNFVAIR